MNSINRITTDSLVDLIFYLKWKSDAAVYTDGYQATGVNIWRDYLPTYLLELLMNKEVGERFQVPLKNGDAVQDFEPNKLFKIQSIQFDRSLRQGKLIESHLGRFYPLGILKGIPGVFKANLNSFRCVGIENGHMTVNFNHPLAGKALDLSVVIGKVRNKTTERGGESIDWIGNLTSGPGMQARWEVQETDYLTADSFMREDNQSDALFYTKPRLVNHIDDTAHEVVKNTYGRFLKNGLHVLDLMSSWNSHLPDDFSPGRMAGLGLNNEELENNKHLTDFVVHDLNVSPVLLFENNAFDAVINTASIEYLTEPLKVFDEVSRVLRPGGIFIVTFSNRWFPTKAIKIWSEIHEFERMGLVLEYFMRSGVFTDLQTYSMRGLPRPINDKYFPDLIFSDPVYAVWGRKVPK